MIAFAGELRFRETNGDGGTRQFLSAVGHIEFLDGRSAAARPASEAAMAAPETDESGADDIPF